MGRAVGADEAGAVHGEAHRQLLDRDVMHDLIVGALQEGRVDGGERLEAFGREPRGERHAVLLGDADIESALGKFLLELVDAGARRHRRGDGDDLRILARFLDQAFAVNLLIRRRSGFRLDLRAGRDVELDHAVIFVGGFFRRLVALALLRHDMDQERAIAGVAHVFQYRQQVVDIVTVDRADIEEAELVEQRAAGDQTAGIFLDRDRALLEHAARQALGDLPHPVAQAAIGRAGHAARQIGRQRADRRRDRHVVVVEHDDQPRVHRAGIVHRLIGHAGGHRAVADHGDDVVLLAVEIAGHRHAQPGGNRGRGMCGTERIVFALGALGETREPAALAERANAVAAAGEDLVRIGLVADVPD